MASQIPRNEIAKLPWLVTVPTDGRIVPLQNYFEVATRDWHLYVEHEPGKLIRLADGEAISGAYYGKGPADPIRDLEFPLGELVTQYLSFQGVLGALAPLDNDIHRFAAILEKYELMWRHRKDSHLMTPHLVESELEYLLLLLRSFYDCLQNVIRNICSRLYWPGDPPRRVAKDLPASFRAVVLAEKKEIRDASQIAARFEIPSPLAEWYRSEAETFCLIRDLRDGIAHHGRRPPYIFELEWGFGVPIEAEPWNRLISWDENRVWNGRLGSLRAVFADLISHALDSTTRFANVVPTFLKLAPPLGEDLLYFIRSPFGRHLTQIAATKSQPWEGRTPDAQAEAP